MKVSSSLSTTSEITLDFDEDDDDENLARRSQNKFLKKPGGNILNKSGGSNSYSRNDEDILKNKSKSDKSKARLLKASLAERTLEFDLPSISPKNAYNIENYNIMQHKGRLIHFNQAI